MCSLHDAEPNARVADKLPDPSPAPTPYVLASLGILLAWLAQRGLMNATLTVTSAIERIEFFESRRRVADVPVDLTAQLSAYLRDRLQHSIGTHVTIGKDTLRLLVDALERPTVRLTSEHAAESVSIPVELPAPMPVEQSTRQLHYVQDERAPGKLAAHPRKRVEEPMQPPCDTEPA